MQPSKTVVYVRREMNTSWHAVGSVLRHGLVPVVVLLFASIAPAQDAKETARAASVAKAGADAFVGTFANDQVTALFDGASGSYSGVFAVAGELFPFTARKQPIDGIGGGIAGAFRAGGESFDFTARVDGDVLTLRSGGAEFQLRRKSPRAGGGNPLLVGRVAQAPALKPGFKLHEHPLGFSFQAPKAWNVLEYQGALVLSMPDAKQSYGAQAEFVTIAAAPAEGIERPNDPRVKEYLQGLFAQTLGMELKPVGGVESIQTGPREGAVITWKGTFPGPVGGSSQRFRARAYVVLMNGYGVTLSYVGPTLQLKKRDPVLREILATFSYDAKKANAPIEADAPVDERLVGRWYRSVYRRSALPGGMNTSFHQTMIMAPDGKLSWVDQTVITGEQKPGQVSSGWTFSGMPESAVNRGRWTASGKTVRMTWSGGRASYSVHVQGAPGRREMLLTPQGGGEKELWTEYAN